MKCERCQKNAATRAVAAEKNGQPCELFVCDACANEAPKTQGAVSLADILFSLSASPATMMPPGLTLADAVADSSIPAVVSCPACGMTRDVLRDRRRFGCPVCYETFGEDVRALLRELQYGDSHVGRTPRKTGLRRRFAVIEAALADAVRAQNFEEAAKLRDQLKNLEAPNGRSKELPNGEG